MLALGALAAVCGLGVGSAKATVFNLLVSPTTLDQLLVSGNSATVGSLTFVFTPGSYLTTGTGVFTGPTSAASISVSAFTSVPGEPGVQFVSTPGWSAGGTGPGSVDTKFSFSVTSGIGPITDDYLSTAGGATAVSSWFVDETVTTPAGATLTNFLVNSPPLNGTVVATALFSPGQTTLNIAKDINLSATSGFASISDVAQGFSVPVPAAALSGMSLLGGLGVLGAFRKVRRA
jgi:hypothetical protein